MLKTKLVFQFKIGILYFFLFLLNPDGSEIQASKLVLFKAMTAQKEDYEAYLLSHPNTISFMNYFQNQRPPLQSKLLELLALAREKDLEEKQKEAKKLYIQAMDLFFVGGHWNNRTLSLFVLVAGRLYQLDKNTQSWKKFLQKMLRLNSKWKEQLKHKDFKPIHTQAKEGSRKVSWDFTKQFPLAEKVLVNGVPLEKTLSLVPGFYKFTLLSNAFHPIEALLHTDSLASWHPQWIPFLTGDCTRPLFHYPPNVKPQKILWFFNMVCVRPLVQMESLSKSLSDALKREERDFTFASNKQELHLGAAKVELLGFSKEVPLLTQGPFQERLKDKKKLKKSRLKSSKKIWWGIGVLGAGFLILKLKGKSITLSLPF